MSQSPSRKVITIVALLAMIVAISVVLMSRRAKVHTDPVERQALMVMRSDLRGLVSAEDATRKIRGRYSADPTDAGHISSPGVTPPVITLSDSGWSAIVSAKNLPELRCAVAVDHRNPLKRFAKSGEIVCE